MFSLTRYLCILISIMASASLLILFAALLPVVILMGVMMWRDKQQPEPISWLLRGFLLGIAAAFGSLLISGPLLALGLVPSSYGTMLGATWYSFGVAAIPEELSKLFFLWLLLRRNPHFDEHLDGVVYAVCVGLGFAGFENIQYLFSAGDHWPATAIARALLSVPVHFFLAVLMGYYYSLVHFGHHVQRNRLLVIGAPVLAHGIFDALAMTMSISEDFGVLFTIVLLLFCNELRKLCTRHIRELSAADGSLYQK